jgi:RibD domain-containing protein/FAD binding domain-containing protein
VDTLREHDLVDEYYLMVHPIVLGHGKRLFQEGTAGTELALTDCRPAGPDVLLLIYRPANRPSRANGAQTVKLATMTSGESSMKVVVVGAGVSGLTCAVTLLEAGAEVVVWTAGAPSGTVSAVAVLPDLARADVLGIEVGLRPGRPRVRLETEQVAGTTVIHDYGHNGSGVFWSWGCATEVAGLCGLG